MMNGVGEIVGYRQTEHVGRGKRDVIPNLSGLNGLSHAFADART